DGTAAVTLMLKDIEPGSSGSIVKQLHVFNGKLYFYAATVASGPELWLTDGTSAGTRMWFDFAPAGKGVGPDTIFAWRNAIYFTCNFGGYGAELCHTDGGGTYTITDINPGAGGSGPQNFTDAGDAFYF